MSVKHILSFRNDRFGEFLLNIPAFRALKQSFPGATLTLVVNPGVRELARSIETVDDVIIWENRKHHFREIYRFSREIKNKQFDLCVILNPSKEFNIVSFLAGIPCRVGYDRKWGFLLTHKLQDKKHLGCKHEIEYNLELVNCIGARSEDKSLSLKIDESSANGLFNSSHLEKAGNLIAVHPWTSDSMKQWPLGSFRKLAQRLAEDFSMKVLIIGSRDNLEKSVSYFSGLEPNTINLTGKTTLTQLAALLMNCKALVSADSGPVHLASCVGLPVVAIFRNDIPGKGPKRWGPVSPGSVVIEGPSLCEIKVEEVLEKVKGVMKK